jgi:hypothetical protein
MTDSTKDAEAKKARKRAYQREWERRTGRTKKLRVDPEFRAKENARSRAYARKHRVYQSIYQKNRRDRLAAERIGRNKPSVCDICGETRPPRQIHLDHCHQQGHARGWLCQRCNFVLGEVKDNTHLLRKLISYLDRNVNCQSPQLALPGI